MTGNQTALGQYAVSLEKRILNVTAQALNLWKCNLMSNEYATADGLLLDHDERNAALGEAKSRFDIDEQLLRERYKFKLLTDAAGIDHLATLSKLLRIPAYIANYIALSNVIFVVKIADDEGKVLHKCKPFWRWKRKQNGSDEWVEELSVEFPMVGAIAIPFNAEP